MFFSVITVVYNDLENLKITCKSVTKQTFDDYEYIIVDGGSTDGTIDYLMDLSRNNLKIKYISEKDHGIYDAMNKGVKIANGDYIIFLGAADVFYSEEILKEVSYILTKKQLDVFYGRCVISSGENKGKYIGAPLNFLNILFDHYVAHQSVFAKRNILLSHPFDISIKALADQDFMLKVKKEKYRIKYFNKVICCYDGEGFSADTNILKTNIKDRLYMLKKYYPFIFVIRQIGRTIIKHEYLEI